MGTRTRKRSLIPELGFRHGMRFVIDMLRRRQISSAMHFLFAVLILDSLRAMLPTWVRRYWWLALIGLGFLLCEGVLLISTIPLQQLPNVAAQGTLQEKLGLARLITAVLTFLLAIVGAGLAIAEIHRALARPSLLLTFTGLSRYMATPFVPKSSGTPDEPWTCCEIPLRVWNLSDVTAHHFKARLMFQDLEPFLVEVHSYGVRAGKWKPRDDLPGKQYEFRSHPSFKVYSQDVDLIGHIRLRLPAAIAEHVESQFPHPHTIWIRAFLHHEGAGRQQMLGLTLEPARSESVAKGKRPS